LSLVNLIILFLQAADTADRRSPCVSDLKSKNDELKVIEQKIADKTKQLSEPTTFSGAKQLTRHEMDLEKAVTQDRDSAKLFHCLVTEKSFDSVDLDHPINHLDQIWKDVLSSKPTCRRRKRKRAAASVTTCDDTCEMKIKVSSGSGSEETNTKSKNEQDEESGKILCHGRLPSQSSDGSKQQKCDIEPVPIEVIERYRLSVEQIKQIPRFQNYSAGTPSPV